MQQPGGQGQPWAAVEWLLEAGAAQGVLLPNAAAQPGTRTQPVAPKLLRRQVRERVHGQLQGARGNRGGCVSKP